MRRYLIVPLLLAATATPALATETITCRAGRVEVLRLSIGIGGVDQATLIRGSAQYATHTSPRTLAIAQAWIDPTELKVDLLDGNYDARMGQLRTRAAGTDTYTGTLVQNGRTIQVRCVADG